MTDVLAAVVLGVAAGALVTEGAVLVPTWRALAPTDFLAWYRRHAGLLFRFFGTLEVVALLAALAAFALDWRAQGAPSLPRAVAAALCLAVLAVFPLYFQRVNASFEQATIALDRVPAELARWARWHWARTALALGAAIAAVLAARGGGA
jgi:hypothetical protein